MLETTFIFQIWIPSQGMPFFSPSPLGLTCAAIKIDEISAVSSSSDDNDECRDKQQHELPKINGVLAHHTMPLAGWLEFTIEVA